MGHDGVWQTTADDIAEYYIANYYDQMVAYAQNHRVGIFRVLDVLEKSGINPRV